MLDKKLLLVLIFCGAALSLFSYTSAQTTIPPWIKATAGFWYNDQISDKEFISALQFLIDNDILKVSDPAQTVLVPTQDIPNLDTIEIPVNENSKDKVVNTDLDLLQFKILQMQELAENPDVIQAVIDSNAKFDEMEDVYTYMDEKDAEWKNQPENQNSPFMNLLIENSLANFLKTKSVITTEEYGDVLFPEIIVTNEFGANVAITIRTSDYRQSDEGWWLKSKNESVQIREVTWDESAKIYSADIVIRIVDDQGKFIGVLNAATPVR